MMLPLLLLLTVVVLGIPWIGGRVGGSKGAAAATVITVFGVVGLGMNRHWHWPAPHIRTEAAGYMAFILAVFCLLILLSGGISMYWHRRRGETESKRRTE
jgi:hypothetical protein